MSNYDFDEYLVESNQLIEHLVSSLSSPSAHPVNLDLVLDDEDLATIQQLIMDFPESQEEFDIEATVAETLSELLMRHKHNTFFC